MPTNTRAMVRTSPSRCPRSNVGGSSSSAVIAAAAVAFLAIVANASILTGDREQLLSNDGIAFGSSRLGLVTSSAAAASSSGTSVIISHRALLQRRSSEDDSSDSSKAEDSSEEIKAPRKRGSSSDAGDDCPGAGQISSNTCTRISGSVPSANYGLSIDGEKKERMEMMYDQARRRCRHVRVLLIGDSIINHLRESRLCHSKIFERYSGKGLNLGINRMGARAIAMLVRQVFEDTCMSPQVVYLAAGVNDCLGGKSYRDATRGMIDSIKIVKHFSPGTHVVVQKVLPTSRPSRAYAGKRWEDQEYFGCVERVNRDVGKWIREHQSSCISHEDMEDLVLDSSGRFRRGTYGDGIHFLGGGNMDSYCEKIAGAVEPYRGVGAVAR